MDSFKRSKIADTEMEGKKYSTFLSIKEQQTKTILRFYLNPRQNGYHKKKKKKKSPINPGKDFEGKEPFNTFR